MYQWKTRDSSVKVIYLAPFGIIDEEVLTTLEICLWQIFGFEVKRMPPHPEPTRALDAATNQYNSAYYLKDILDRVPDDAVRVLGITTNDLFIPMLSFVFGHAQLNGPASVISLARLHQTFYRLPENKQIFFHRVMKEAVHELGHTFGLIHCTNTLCAMSLSNVIQQVDKKTEELCVNCSILFEDITKQIHRENGMEIQR
jgi:archaemetzincin